MWNTIANFKDNLTQIASDVLDTADELKRSGSQGDYDDEIFDSHGTSHRSAHADKESDLKAELEWYRNEVPRLQAAESEIQSSCMNYVSVLKDREDELLRIREENGILKNKLTAAASDNSSQTHKLRGEVKQLQVALKELESQHQNSKELHQKQAAELQDYYQKQCELLISQQKQELANVKELYEANHLSSEKSLPSKSNGTVPHSVQDLHIENLESQVLQLQHNEKDLSSQLSGKDEIYEKLRTAYDMSMSEVKRLKEQRSKDKEASLQKDSQLQRDHEAAEAAARECEVLRLENITISGNLGELQKCLNEQDATREKTMQELQLTISNLARNKAELEEERDGLLKTLQDHVQASLDKVSTESTEMISEKDLVALKEAATTEVDRLLERANEAEEACASQKLDFETQLEKVMGERDKAIRDLGRLRQHLLDKELADSEKMDQDSEQIADLQALADASLARAVQAEQSLSVALTDLRDVRKFSREELSRATEEVGVLHQKLASCIAALESKDVELSNLQSALGQYYAESEAQDRVYLELSAAKEECGMLSQQLQIANQTTELRNGERDAAIEKLALTENRTLENQQKMQKLEEEVVRLRRALEQSMTRLNSLSSDSDHHVDRRIVIKLLVTYFQKNHSKEVLDLMVRMLGFSEEDKRRVGIAQQAASRGVVRGVLGLPGRFVGGIIGGASADQHSLPSPSENKSFADLWIDFLLKESEERERREKAAAIEKAEIEMGRDEYSSRVLNNKLQTRSSMPAQGSISTPPSPSHVINHMPSTSFSNFSSASPSPKEVSAPSHNVEMASQLPGSANGKVLVSQSSDVVGNDFSSIPLYSSSASGHPHPTLGHIKVPPRF